MQIDKNKLMVAADETLAMLEARPSLPPGIDVETSSVTPDVPERLLRYYAQLFNIDPAKVPALERSILLETSKFAQTQFADNLATLNGAGEVLVDGITTLAVASIAVTTSLNILGDQLRVAAGDTALTEDYDLEKIESLLDVIEENLAFLDALDVSGEQLVCLLKQL